MVGTLGTLGTLGILLIGCFWLDKADLPNVALLSASRFYTPASHGDKSVGSERMSPRPSTIDP